MASAATTSSNKRHSILPPISQSGPKPPVVFAPSLTIADSAVLVGTSTITIGAESVIHPRARLDSAAGAVVVGRRCIVHERSCVGAPPPDDGAEDGERPGTGGGTGTTLGDCVTVEVGATVEAGGTVVGDGTVVGVGTRIGKGAVIGKHCTITAQTVIAPGTVLPDLTVVYSNGMRRPDRRGVSELRNKVQVRQIEVLRKSIPSSPTKFQ